ncbi:MAG TPA: TRAFs-binding domain-containing protein, partial [Chthoniobacterales bacterium]|nr:TRAFs-binding domain-containing protein [Chthoniobacterales bacterium]
MSDLPEVKNAPAASVALHELWRRRHEWMDDIGAVRAFVKRALSAGEFLTAYDAARATIDNHPDDDWLQQRMALALAQMGSPRRAQDILKALIAKNPTDRETLSILGRTYKDRWCAIPENEHYLRQAFDYYNRAFEVSPPDSYPGINAATIAVLLKENDKASRIAKTVLEICEKQPDDYWKHATVAEALVVQGDVEGAKRAYRAAVAAESDNLRAFSSTRKQARVLSRQLYGRGDVFDECFPIPKLVVFSGHMIDAPDRRHPRFPPTKEAEIKELLEKQLATMNAGIGFSSAASGSDILFLEAMLARGGTIHLVLPWPAEEFVKTSVAIAGDETWVERFHKVVGQAASIRVLGELYMPGSATGFEYCNLAMNGLARLFAQSLDLEITPLAVWDGYAGAPGGTGSFVRYWRTHRVPVKVVPIATKPPSMLTGSETFEIDANQADDEFEVWVRASGRQEIKAIMFADVVGYSKLPETVIPKYVAQFNQRVSRLMAESSAAPINVNTWGDGLFFVFNGVEDAGRFALDLRDLVVNTNWVDLGLPRNLNIRIGVHAGPVYVNF